MLHSTIFPCSNIRHGLLHDCEGEIRYPTWIARFMAPTWGSSGSNRTQVGPMLAPWTLPSGNALCFYLAQVSLWTCFLSLVVSMNPFIKPWSWQSNFASTKKCSRQSFYVQNVISDNNLLTFRISTYHRVLSCDFTQIPMIYIYIPMDHEWYHIVLQEINFGQTNGVALMILSVCTLLPTNFIMFWQSTSSYLFRFIDYSQNTSETLQWHRNGCDCIWNHQPHECFFLLFIQAQIKANIKAPRHWPLCGEFTSDRWIPFTNVQLRRKCFYLMTSSWSVFTTQR